MSSAPSDLGIWIAIIGVSCATVLTRSLLLLLGERVQLPPLVDRLLAYAPACALSAIVIPNLVLNQGVLQLTFDNYRLLAALVATVAFLLSRNLLTTIGAGMAAFTLLRLFA